MPGNKSKTNQELREEIRCGEVTKKEREVSNGLYAIKLVEKIVLGFVKLLLIIFATALIYLVIKQQIMK